MISSNRYLSHGWIERERVRKGQTDMRNRYIDRHTAREKGDNGGRRAREAEEDGELSKRKTD